MDTLAAFELARACQTCHHYEEGELRARVDAIQQRNHGLMERAGAANVELIDAIKSAKAGGMGAEQLRPMQELQRKAQWRLDFVAAENSMGFHAPQETARILGESIDYARQGRLPAMKFGGGAATTRPAAR